MKQRKGHRVAIKVYGASDDLIEVDGDVEAEFYALKIGEDEDDGGVLAFSDGTVLRIIYTRAGVWRITPVAIGVSVVDIVQAPEDNEDNYSDVATLTHSHTIQWVVCGTEVAKARS